MNSDNCILLISSFIKSQFSYFLLIWMFCNQKSMKKFNTIQERYLRLLKNNYKVNYEGLCNLTNKIFKHQWYLNSLMTVVCKCLNRVSPSIMNDILTVSKHHYNTRHYNLFVIDGPKTDRYGQNSIL